MMDTKYNALESSHRSRKSRERDKPNDRAPLDDEVEPELR